LRGIITVRLLAASCAIRSAMLATVTALCFSASCFLTIFENVCNSAQEEAQELHFEFEGSGTSIRI
jgi:hypothetical protein